MKTIKLFFQFLLGFIYLISGISKAADINGFADILMQYGYPNLFLLAPIITFIEIVFAFLVFLSWNTRRVALFSLVFISVISVVFIVGHFYKGVEDCGCLGSFYELPSWISITRNILMILISYWLFLQGLNYKNTRMELFKLITSIAFGFATLFLSSHELWYTYKRSTYQPGESIKNTVIGQYLKNSDDEALIFLFSPNCEHCLKITPKVIEKANELEYKNIIGLYPKDLPDSLLRNFNIRFKPNFQNYPVPYDSLTRFTQSIPFFISVRNGRIKKVGIKI
jgi:uncharacterized membrane protein YphA (DoxX/SURF4 family)